MPFLALHLLGPPRIERVDLDVREAEPVTIGRTKALALLAYLAVTGRRHRRDALATLLWPRFGQSGARAELRRALSVINRALGTKTLEADRESAGLNPQAQIWLDVNEFRQLLAASDACAKGHARDQVCPECTTRLAEAAETYHDDFMAGFTLPDAPAFDDWQRLQTQNLRYKLESALERLAGCLAARGDYDAAIAVALRWLELDMFHEPAHRVLMELYARAGRHSDALRQYRRCVRVLDAQLGVVPSLETTALYENLRVESPPLSGRRILPSKRPFTDERPPRFAMQDRPSDAAEAPMFVGREQEMAQLEHCLEDALGGRGQVVFITGGPGRGKTALMREFARRVMVEHPELLVASGNCNAYSGVGDPYLPFREIVAMLSGDVEAKWATGLIGTEHARRLWSALPITVQVFLDHGPYLIDALVDGRALLRRALTAVSDRPEWLRDLEGWVVREKGEYGSVEQNALFLQFGNTLCALAEMHPLVLALDDLQWVDSSSAGLLFHLGRRLPDTGGRILIVGAYRPEEIAVLRDGQSHPLEKALTEFKRQQGDVWIDLSRAGREEQRQFVETLLDSQPNRLGNQFRAELARRTGGHALFTVELLHAMQERGDLIRTSDGRWIEGQALDWSALPARVEAVIRARLDPLDEGLREILTVASVEGESFTAQVVAHVLNIPELELIRTLSRELGPGRHRLVWEAEEVVLQQRFLSRYRFTHSLYQSHLYNELSSGERRLLHGEIGSGLEALHGEQAAEIAARLAHHFELAGRAGKAVEYSLRAGERARRTYASEEARAHYVRALALLGTSGEPNLRLEALRKLGQVNYGLGKLEAAEADLRAAIALGSEIGLPAREMVRIYHWLAEVLWWQACYDEQIRIGEQGLALLAEEASSAGSAEPVGPAHPALQTVEAALMNQAIAMGHARGGGGGEDHKRFTYRTAAFIRDLPYSGELRYAYDHVASTNMIDKRVEEAQRWHRALAEKAQRHHDLRALMMAHRGIGQILSSIGDVAGAVSECKKALELNTKASDATITLTGLNVIQWALLWQGDLQRCDAFASMHLETAQSAASGWSIAEGYRCLGTIRLCRGEANEAVNAFRTSLKCYQDVETQDQVRALMSLGRAFLARGCRRDALRHFQMAVTVMAPAPTLTAYNVPASRPVFANSVAGLEDAYEDPAAFRAFCDRLQEELAADVKSVIPSWYLEATQPPEGAGSPISAFEVGVDDLEILQSTSRDAPWRWVDPFDDCSFRLQNGVEMQAANARDLWHVNLSAPRLLRNAPKAKELTVQTLCRPVSEETPAIGGILLWKDKENYVRLDRGVWGRAEISFMGCLGNEDRIIGRGSLESARRPANGWSRRRQDSAEDGVILRLTRVGDRVRALCSADGAQWFSVGEVEFPFDDGLQVGLHAIGMIDRTVYHGAFPDGTAIRFESFELWGGDD